MIFDVTKRMVDKRLKELKALENKITELDGMLAALANRQAQIESARIKAQNDLMKLEITIAREVVNAR